MTIKAPPERLIKATFETLTEGTVIHRVHLSRFGPTDFNPCEGGPTRFAPIRDTEGQCIPSLYAGQTLETAIFESIFHDVPAKPGRKTILIQATGIKSHSFLVVARDLKLVSLRGPTLKAWGLRRENLIGTTAKLYEQTAKWAAAVHRDFPQADGLVWTSNQCDPDSAYLFFGGRVQPPDLHTRETRDGLTDKEFLTDIRSAGKRADIRISQ